MTPLKILKYPEDAVQLTQKASLVTPEMASTDDFKTKLSQLHELLKNEKHGIGIAASQADWPVSLFILNRNETMIPILPKVFLNPKITEYSKATNRDSEGCLSFPDLFLKIERPYRIKWTYQTLDFEIVEKESECYYGRAVQHEVGHLAGSLFIELAPKSERHLIEKWLSKKKEKYEEENQQINKK